jgi:hypothetical protein
MAALIEGFGKAAEIMTEETVENVVRVVRAGPDSAGL